MSKVQLLPDEKLIGRAGHAARNLFAIAILATILAVCLGMGCAFEPKIVVWSAVPWIFATCGCWLLAIAAKRGNPKAVFIVMVVLSIHCFLSINAFCITIIRSTPSGGGGSLLAFVFIFLIIVVLDRSRAVLMEMKKRGLWNQRFGSSKPSKNLCILGGSFYAVGYFGFLVSLLVPAIEAAKNAKALAEERRQAQAVIQMIQQEEADFFKSMQSLDDPKAVKNALAKVDVLDQKVASLQVEIPADGTLARIMKEYKRAVQDWKSGLIELDNPVPDLKAAKEKLEYGDKIRNEFTKEFDKKFSPK